MNASHIIRLRGPWQRLVEGQPATSTKPIQMPANWVDDLGRDFCGRVTYIRWFHRPTSLAPDTPLTLTFHEIVGDAWVSLNAAPLGEARWPHHPHRFNVTGTLQSRNELRVEVRSLTPAERASRTDSHPVDLAGGGLVGEVHLEIG